MLDMMRVAEEVGVSFAYPTQTIYLARSPGVPPVPEDLSPTQDKALNEQRGREATRRVVKDAPWQESKPPPYQFRSAAETLAIDQGEDPSIHQNVHSEDGDTETRGSAGE